MNKHKPVRNCTMKTLLKYSVASLTIITALALPSCKKDAKDTVPQVTVSDLGPIYGDGPHQYESNAMISVPLAALDKDGNLISTSKNIGQKPTGDGCDFLFYNYSMLYRGYRLDDICFASVTYPGSTYLNFTYDVVLPADINPLPSDPQSTVRVRLVSSGFMSSPTGTGFRTLNIASCTVVETFNTGAPDNLDMKRWRVTTTQTPFNGNDYCLNTSVQSVFKLATDCASLPYITSSPGIITESLEPTKKLVPSFIATNSSSSPSHKFTLQANLPLCQLPTCKTGNIEWADTYKIRYRKQGTTTWIEYTPPPALSFVINVTLTGAGIYEYQMMGRIMSTTPEVWSDWSSIGTVNVL